MGRLVAITSMRETRQYNGAQVGTTFLFDAYLYALSTCGLTPIIVPPILDEESLRRIYQGVDGIVLSGGGDMHPRFLDTSPEENTYAEEIDEARDETELRLVRWAFEDDKPLFGICRGQQVMNVALGGSLIMDIPAQIGETVPHQVHNDPQRRFKLLHDIQIEPQTKIASILGAGTLSTNSIHHQAVKDIAPPLQCTSTAPDGIIESLEAPEARFFLGVQWHPEEIYTRHPKMHLLFQAFADTLG